MKRAHSVVVVASSSTDSKFGVNSDYPFAAARVGQEPHGLGRSRTIGWHRSNRFRIHRSRLHRMQRLPSN